MKMADTRIQVEVEDWVRREWMPEKFGQRFYRERLQLSSGGIFDFDAVSEDHKIVATISTSGAKTARGKNASGKLFKIRSDMFFLLLVRDVNRRIVVLTETDMVDLCKKETTSGRVPNSIEFVHAVIPEDVAAKLRQARGIASSEVSPKS
jgi:hypothetical protein